MKTVIEMAREAGWPDSLVAPVIMAKLAEFAELVRADAIADEREHIAQMIDNAPALVEDVTNDQGGCLMCGFTPKLAVSAIHARSNT